uniref:ABC-type glutathione-S-conjugate transporter n=1 Tax=Brachionus koreanus TaxID=1199090 RepID=A0A1J0MMS4_9BILA|nr:ATP-binding cassette transporter subfamily C member 1 X4 protein [Brachionus koreanus]
MLQILSIFCESQSSFFLRRENETYPVIVDCYQYIIPIWIPCLLFWILLPFWTMMLYRKKFFNIHLSILLFTKSTFIGLSILNEVIIFFKYPIQKNEYSHINSWLLIITYTSSLCLLHYERFRGLPSSALNFIFWASLTLTSPVSIYSQIAERVIQGNILFKENDLILFSRYFLIYINLILACLAEIHSTYYERRKNNCYPQNEVSILSRLTFWWLNDQIFKGARQDLTSEDLFKIDDYELSKSMSEKFEYHWKTASQTYLKLCHEKRSRAYKTKCNIKEEEKINFLSYQNKFKKPSLAKCIFKTFYGRFLAGAFIKVCREICVLIQPVILGSVIRYVKNNNEPLVVGLLFVFLLFTVACIQSCLFHHYFDRMFNVGFRIKIALMDLIYKKSLRLSNNSRKESTVGQMVNILAVNAQSFVEYPHHLNMIWSSLFTISIAVILLWNQLGIAALAGVLTMVILIPINSVFMSQSKKFLLKKYKHQDSRVKIINELLNGIKIIKFYAWELCFKKLIDGVRSKEVLVIKKIAHFNAISYFAWTLAPFLVSVVSFGIFVFINDASNLTAETAFVSLSLFNSMRHPLAMLPNTISNIIQANISVKRISTFLLKEEIDQSSIIADKSIDFSVYLKECTFGWDYDNELLNEINLKIKFQSLVSIIGRVGQGKSSLLSAIIGEMEKFNGTICVNGSIAYAPQQAWIQNATIRANILFGKPFDQTFYEKVIAACSLNTDLELLKFGDMTEIGEKGINLSGGQKQRISLARCVYANCDIYLLDDCLSAVDAHVGKHIYDRVIGSNGLLKDKTRIFVTNSLNFLSHSDEIFFMENGSIIETGSYEALIEKNGYFSDFMKSFLDSKNTEFSDYESRENDQPTKTESNVKSTKTNDEQLIQKEKIESGLLGSSIFLNYFRACNVYLILLFYSIYALSAFFQISSSFWLSHWTNNSNNANRNLNFGIYFFLGFLNCTMSLCADYLFVFMYTKAAKKLHESLLSSIIRCGMKFFESTPIGRILNRFAKDMETIEIKIPDYFKSFSRNFFNTISVVFVILIATPQSILALIPIFFLFIFFQRFYAKYSIQIKRLESAARSPIYAFFAECLNGVSTIRAFKADERFIRQAQHHLDNNARIFYSDYSANRWVGIRLEFTGSLVILASSMFIILNKEYISPETAGLTLSYALTITLTLIWVVRSFSDFETHLISVERVREYCDLPHEAEWVSSKQIMQKAWPSQGSIDFKNFSLKYREELDFVLKDINCHIISQEKVGIVGRTGAGKSSLTLGLFRILESNHGRIEIDGIDIKTIGLHELREKLTIIPQEPVLFGGSLRTNLDPFEEYSDEKILNALEHAHLKEFVDSLSQGLEFECTEGGDNLSVGQRQLICLARALLRKTKILILDEATASIDPNTDDLIQSTIRSQFKDCTILTIAHRLNTIIDNDRIMVLDSGKLVEFDSPSKLLSNSSSLFYSMAKEAGLV